MNIKKKVERMLHLRGLKRRWNMFLVNKIYAGESPKHFEKKRRLLNNIGFEIGENTKVVGPIFTNAKVRIGKNCWIGKNLIINGIGSVVIGDNCDVAPEVTFLTGGHAIGDESRRAGEGRIYHIEVGNGTWIGARTTILNNVVIGDSCVIAACSCVNKNVEANMLIGGVPARTIRVLTDD